MAAQSESRILSWSEAKAVADAVFRDLSKNHDPGFVRMVIRALERQLNADEKRKKSDSTVRQPLEDP